MKFSDLQKSKELPATPAKPAPAAEPPARRLPKDELLPAENYEPRQEPAAPPQIQGPPAPVAAHITGRVPLLKPSESGRLKPAPQLDLPFRELDAKAAKTYSRLLAQSRQFIDRMQQPYTEQYRAVTQVCVEVIEGLRANPVLINYASYSTPGGYLPGHVANTTLLSLAIGVSMSLEPRELELLGFSAMATDIGMKDFEHLYSTSARLSNEDYAQLTQHAEEAAAKLDCIVDLDYKVKQRAAAIIVQTHERADGSGYPRKLAAGEIDPLSQIIGIADTYEAMTHPRSWREAIPAPEAIKELIDREGRTFNSKVVKHLISILSIFPPGSLVALSTGELAKVIKVNKGSLTRPLVEVIADPQFAEISPRELDLLKHPLTAVDRAISYKEIDKLNAELAGRLELARWWND